MMMPIANCSLVLPATLNTCCIRSASLNASITTLSLFVNAVTTFNYLIVHPFSETKTSLWECCIVKLFTENSVFLALIHCVTAFLSVILLKLKWNEIKRIRLSCSAPCYYNIYSASPLYILIFINLLASNSVASWEYSVTLTHEVNLQMPYIFFVELCSQQWNSAR